jgi:hypothetical protein
MRILRKKQKRILNLFWRICSTKKNLMEALSVVVTTMFKAFLFFTRPYKSNAKGFKLVRTRGQAIFLVFLSVQ